MTHFIQNLYSGTYFLKTGNTQFYKIILITAQTDISFIHFYYCLEIKQVLYFWNLLSHQKT